MEYLTSKMQVAHKKKHKKKKFHRIYAYITNAQIKSSNKL